MPFVQVVWAAAAAAFPQVVGTSSGGTSSLGNPVSITLPSTLAEGNVLLLIHRSQGDGQHPGPTDSGWTRVFEESHYDSGTDTDYRTSAWRKVIGATQSSPISFSQDNGARCGWVCYEVSGVAVLETDFVESEHIVTSGNPPSLTPSWGSAKTLWIAALAVAASDNTATNPTDFVTQVSGGSDASTADSRAKVYAAHRESEAASEDPAAWTPSGTYFFEAAATIALRPA